MIVEIIFSVFGLLLSIYGVCHLIRSEKNRMTIKSMVHVHM
ncbi:hypothetical protein SAMN05216405_2651 [Lachnospiraceae bacterium NLAE-zl-G231]|nr:hypothetical protein SAMN05216405_2651 [Lachnospiraceae bacterium NLAE-zl-G231]